ncbi:MAG: Gfo/Idh/MocA family oxidoreductase [Planctomycetota bacterium]
MNRTLVIGARRRKLGIGEFVARWFADAGAEVCAVVGTRMESAEEARQTLLQQYGIECRAYTQVEQALAAEDPQIVAICSPYACHREHLLAVASAGAHCLCEKPMWWNETHADAVAEETTRLVDAFLDQNLHLELVTQWPQTLPWFYQLFPEQQDRPVEQFCMQLSPSSKGASTVLDSMPHVISMLQALVGCGDIHKARARFLDAERGELRCEFEYHYGAERVSAACLFKTCETPPRPAGYAINGEQADRVVQLPEYTMLLEGSLPGGRGKSVNLEDPLKLLVRDFLNTVISGETGKNRQALIESMTLQLPLIAAVHELERGSLDAGTS